MSPQPNITPLIPPCAQERYRKAIKQGVAYNPRDKKTLRELTKQIQRSDKKADEAKLVAAGAKKDAKEAKKDAKDAKECAIGAKGCHTRKGTGHGRKTFCRNSKGTINIGKVESHVCK